MMFCGQYNVFRAGVFEGLCPGIRAPLLAFTIEGLGEAVVVVVSSVVRLVVSLRRRTIDADGVVIPLRIWIFLQKSGLVKSTISMGAQPGTE